MERELIRKTLEDTEGNRTHAARILGISLRTLRNKLNEFGLQDRPAMSSRSRTPDGTSFLDVATDCPVQRPGPTGQANVA
jgi:hypothetical protein